jgi:UDP-N-acetyl-D-mannosaminuronic acid transferase (WecB/TagA/CpsF family)
LPYFLFNLFFRRKYLYRKYGERICGSDLTKDLVKFAEKEEIKITIIDLYNPDDRKKVESQKIFKKVLKDKFARLDFDYFVYNPEEKERIIKEISESKSKILFSTL